MLFFFLLLKFLFDSNIFSSFVRFSVQLVSQRDGLNVISKPVLDCQEFIIFMYNFYIKLINNYVLLI